ncbi:3'-5' exoribonuclease [Xenorhabdus bovienii]|nr:3'-5' exoribonuclease [Xenorhabdus bovienii]MDE9566167.1 3'-5' exoribonuclease [Xenorhabdus bovienii]
MWNTSKVCTATQNAANANNNANSRLEKKQNGADIPNKPAFVNSEARAAISEDGLPSITEVLFELEEFVNKNTKYNTHGLKVWGNGASFDNVILRSAYDREKMKPFWRWNNDRDVRTIVELGRAIGFDPKHNMPFEGSRHNALDDAIHQAKYVSIIWQKLINNNNQNDNVG